MYLVLNMRDSSGIHVFFLLEGSGGCLFMLMIVGSSSNLLIVYESLGFAAKRGDYHSSGPEKNDRQMACHVLWSTGGSKVGLQHSGLKPHPRETPIFFNRPKTNHSAIRYCYFAFGAWWPDMFGCDSLHWIKHALSTDLGRWFSICRGGLSQLTVTLTC